ncbi:MAG TPA: NAD-dependent epimerase, partial [Pseudolysinimonas sp.]|nr:NAD-dependent epimerase [Pseudolysinimonas sp.]
PPEYADEAREGNAVLGALIESAPEDLDWVFVSPAATFGAYTPSSAPRGVYRTSTDIALFDAEGNSALEAADLALAVLDEIEHPTHHRSQIHFAY